MGIHCALIAVATCLPADDGFRAAPAAFLQQVATRFGVADGLPADDCRAIIVDGRGEVLVMTAAGAARFDGERFVKLDSSRFPRSERERIAAERALVRRFGQVRDVARAADGSLAVAAVGGLFLKKRTASDWQRLFPHDGARSWYPREARAVAFDEDALWFASTQGVGYFHDGAWRLLTGADGLPYNDVTCAATGPGGVVWFGTRIGAIRYDGETWEYRQGRRWLPHDEVRSIAVAEDGTAWIATAGGVGRIEHVPMTLAEKARFYEEEIDKRHRRTPYGFVLEVTLDRPGDTSVWHNHDSDNDGLWTSMYGAGECFAWAATRDPAARERATKAFEALRFLGTVTQGGTHPAPPGFVARTILPTSGPDPNAGRLEADRRTRATRDAEWKLIDPRWPVSADGKWYWKCDTSSDELDGHYFFYAQYHDLVADTPEEKARVRDVVVALTDHLIEHGFNLVDHDGKPTRWGHFSPQDLNFNPVWWEERGLNSLSMLSYLKVAEHVSGDSKYRDVARELIDKHGYAINALYPKHQTGPSTGNHSDDEMAFMGFYNLLRYERDPELRPIYAHAFHEYWELERPEMNPLFNFMFAAVCRGDTWTDPWGTKDLSPYGDWLEDSIDTLRRFPLDRIDWHLKNSHRLDLVRLPGPDRHGRPLPRGHRRNGKVLPVDERFFEHWNHDPWRLDTGGGGRVLADGAVFLLPYYMGVYHGFIEK